MIDAQGRLFGRFNLVDTLLAFFGLALLPVGYATYLLFRPAAPVITSVDRVEITREERRLAGGSLLTAKLKVRGSGFTPMLRAALDTSPALGFIFENPNSADVIVGELPPGTFDLVLLDGVQEVARARGALTVDPGPVVKIRAVGHLMNLTAADSEALRAGDAYPEGDPHVRVVSLGPRSTARVRLMLDASVIDVAAAERFERPAVVTLRCDPRATDEPCTFGGVAVSGANPVVTLPLKIGFVRFAITELLPESAPKRFSIALRATGGPELQTVAIGDRDNLDDDRAATVTDVGRYISGSVTGVWRLSIVLGADASRDGWRYRGQLLKAGAPLQLSLPRTVVQGTIESVNDESIVTDTR
jgi:hypothetical protein